MDGFARSTIAALFYADPDRIAFPDLVAELASVLLHTASGGLDIHTAYDDFVIFDLADKRICLAHADLAADFPAAARHNGCAEAVVVSVGDKPDAARRAEGQLSLCEGLAERIETRTPASGSIMVESDVALTEDSYDLILEDILAAFWAAPAPAPEGTPEGAQPTGSDSGLSEEIESSLFAPANVYGAAGIASTCDDIIFLPAPALPGASVARHTGSSPERVHPLPFDSLRPVELSRSLSERYDQELAARTSARASSRDTARHHRAPAPKVFPTASYGERRPAPPPRNTRALSAFARLRQQARPGRSSRDDLFPTQSEARAQPLVHRSAIHAMNVATLAFSLPVGAFLLTLAILGRESLVMSSRMTAVTGAGMGIAQHESVAGFVTALL